MKAFLNNSIALFLLLCIVFIPLNFDGEGLQLQITQFLFHDFIAFFQNNFLENALKKIDFSSDTISLNLLVILLFIIAVIIVFILQRINFKNQNFIAVSRTILVYYLAYILLKYGFDKIFKAQFYLPEPNILNSKFGDLSRDILYWSTIGTSRYYSISLGIIEVFTAILLLINRTRIFGLLLAIGVFANIVLVNFSFDISVKTFSTLLLAITVFVAFPFLKTFYKFFIQRKEVSLPSYYFYLIKERGTRNAVKFFVIGLIFIQILLPYVESQNFNDDNFSRPFLHGSYQVIHSNQKKSNFQVTHFYIHRKNYLILENQTGKRIDYFIEINQFKKQIKLIDYNLKTQLVTFNYNKKDSVLRLQFHDFEIISKAINWRKLKVLKNDFHWTIDEMK